MRNKGVTMFKFARFTVFSAIALTILGVVLFGTGFWSLAGTLLTDTQDAAEAAVPVEFQLKRVVHELKSAASDISEQSKRVARLTVDCQDLARDIKKNTANERTLVTKVRYLADAFESTGMGVRPAVFRGREIQPGVVSVELRSATSRLKETRRWHEMKVELLNRKRETLERAQEALFALKDRHSQLQIEIESCRTNIEYVKLVEADLGTDVESSHFSKAEKLLSDLDHRVRVRQEHGKLMTSGGRLRRDASFSNDDMMREARSLTARPLTPID